MTPEEICGDATRHAFVHYHDDKKYVMRRVRLVHCDQPPYVGYWRIWQFLRRSDGYSLQPTDFYALLSITSDPAIYHTNGEFDEFLSPGLKFAPENTIQYAMRDEIERILALSRNR